MRVNLVSGGWRRNSPWATELAFKKGFERLGVDARVVDTEDDSSSIDSFADFSVVFKDAKRPDLKKQLRKAGHPVIVYQPDDMRFVHVLSDMREALEYCEHAAVFETDGVEAAKSMGYRNVTRILLPVDDELYRYNEFPRTVDACFIGNMSDDPCHSSRRHMVEIVSHMPGVRLIATSTFNVRQVVRMYNTSKVVLHHATDVGQSFGIGYGYQSRHFEAGFSGACVLSNHVLGEDHIPGLQYFSDEDELVKQLTWLLQSGQWQWNGKRYYDALRKDYLPEECAKDMLFFMEMCQ